MTTPKPKATKKSNGRLVGPESPLVPDVAAAGGAVALGELILENR